MQIHFHQPSTAQRAGGIDAAIRGLRGALQACGHEVAVEPEIDAPRADVVHFHGLWQASFPGLARMYRRTGTPYVVSPHGMLEPWAWRHKWWKKLPYWHLIERRWVNHANRMLATSKAEALRIGEFVSHVPCTMLPLGLTGTQAPDYDVARMRLGWLPEETVLLFLSRIHRKKGLDLLLKALAQLGPIWPPKCKVVIVGPEEDTIYVKSCRIFTAQNSARLPRIEWIGPIWGDARWDYLRGADLFCLPTLSENFGLVIAEACQVGTPVLTTTATPWGDALRERGGYVADVRVESIAHELRRFFRAPTMRGGRAQIARWARETYDWSVLGSQYSEIYRQVAGRSK